MTLDRLVLIAVASMLAASAPVSAGQLALEAHAGLGGMSRPGRWTPVRVTIDNSGDDVSGVLVVAWGDAVVRRDVTIPSPSRRHIQLYVRTATVESAVRVRLLAKGIEVGSADAPVQVPGHSEALTLCVLPPRDALAVSAESCDARVSADLLPDAARGYDAFDRVVWVGGAAPLESSRREAFRRAHSLREIEALAGTPHVSRPVVPRGIPSHTRRMLMLGASCYLLALLITGPLFGGMRASTARTYVAIGLIVTLGSTAALALGRAGGATAVVVQHSTLVRQLSAGSGSAVLTRAVAQFPAHDVFALRAGLQDAVIERSAQSETKEHIFDEQGDAVLAGAFGLGSRQAFALEGFSAFQPLALRADGSRVRLTNRSGASMRDCRFAEGFSVRDVGVLLPNQTIEATREAETIVGPAVTCTVPELPFEFLDTSRAVRADGVVRVAVYLEAAR